MIGSCLKQNKNIMEIVEGKRKKELYQENFPAIDLFKDCSFIALWKGSIKMSHELSNLLTELLDNFYNICFYIAPQFETKELKKTTNPAYTYRYEICL